MTEIPAEREELFWLLEHPETRPRFWERVADDVDWTVEGTHQRLDAAAQRAEARRLTPALAGQSSSWG